MFCLWSNLYCIHIVFHFFCLQTFFPNPLTSLRRTGKTSMCVLYVSFIYCPVFIVHSSYNISSSQKVKVFINTIDSCSLNLKCPSSDRYKKTVGNPCNTSHLMLEPDEKSYVCSGCSKTVAPLLDGRMSGQISGIGIVWAAQCFTISNVFIDREHACLSLFHCMGWGSNQAVCCVDPELCS